MYRVFPIRSHERILLGKIRIRLGSLTNGRDYIKVYQYQNAILSQHKLSKIKDPIRRMSKTWLSSIDCDSLCRKYQSGECHAGRGYGLLSQCPTKSHLHLFFLGHSSLARFAIRTSSSRRRRETDLLSSDERCREAGDVVDRPWNQSCRNSSKQFVVVLSGIGPKVSWVGG